MILAPLASTVIGLVFDFEGHPGVVSIFAIAVMATVVVGGRLAGIGAGFASILLLDYFFLPPTTSFFFTGSEEIGFNSDSFSSIIVLVVSVGVASLFLERIRKALERAEALAVERNLAWQKTEQTLAAERVAIERTEALQRVTAALSVAGTSAQVVDAALQEGVPATRAFACVLGILEADGQVVRQHAIGLRDAGASAHELFDVDSAALLGIANAVTGEALWFSSRAELERAFPHAREQLGDVVYESVCVVPLVTAGERVGFLAFLFDVPQSFSSQQRTFVGTVAAQCADAIGRARLLDRAREARDRAVRLQAVTAALAGASSQQAVGAAVIELGLPLLHAEGGAMYVVDDAELRLVAMLGYDPAVIRGWEAIPLDASTPVTHAARTRTAVHLVGRSEMLDAFPEVYGAVVETNEHAMVCIPLVRRGMTIGALYVGFPDERRLDNVELALLESLVTLGAEALERARLLELEQAAAARTAALQQVTASLSGAATATDVIRVAIEQGLGTIGAQRGAIGLLEADGEHVRRFTSGYETQSGGDLFPLDMPLPGIELLRSGDGHWFTTRAAVEERYPVSVEVFAGLEFASMCVLPLLVRGRRAGFLSAFFDERRAFTPGERRFVEAVTAQCAQALERAQLLDAERIAADRVRRLQEVTAELAAAITVDDVARIVVRRGVAALGAAAGALVLKRGDALELVEAIGYSDELVALYRGVPLPSGRVSAAADTIRSGVPRWVESLEEMTQSYPLEELELDTRLESEALVPLRFAGAVNGVLVVSFVGARRLTPSEKELLLTFARQCGQALGSALVYERDHRIAETFQHSLLPEALPLLPTMRTAARYLPGSDEAVVGGDWYDLIERGNCIFGGVGDVGGKGVVAASRMGQLRTALRAYGLGGMSPAEVLEHANRLAEATESFFATLVVLDLDLETGELRYSSAGHPPPLLLRGDGDVAFLDGGLSVPFGVAADTVFVEDHVILSPGDRLIVYTDGLVERRGEQLDVGLERLRDAVRAWAGAALDVHVDRVLEAMLPGGKRADDVAVLALEVIALTAPGFAYRSGTDTAALRILRGELREWLSRSGAHEATVEEIVLSTSEAAANAIEHALTPRVDEFEVDGRVDGDEVVLTIRDYGGWRAPRNWDERGRGILLMRALMDDVEIDEGQDGTRVTLRRRLA